MQYNNEPYVPYSLRNPKDFATFNKELVNAVTCCEAVEQEPWSANLAQEVLQRARRRKGKATVRAVSLRSDSSGCAQRFMAFEAKESDGHYTYILAFRNDRRCYDDMVSTPAGFAEDLVENDNNFQVHKSLWWRAATLPLRSLPPQWRSGLRDRRHRLILTGFSVAGAVAALATLQLLESEDPDLRQLVLDSVQICCYTFGAPLQGDQTYANCINHTYASNFYHMMVEGDTIPGVLTLISKVAENKPDVAGDVVSNICKGLGLAAQVAVPMALNAVAPGTGSIFTAIASNFDFVKLGSGIKNLIVTERESRMPMPEYRFGGSLVLLDPRKSANNQMMFVPLLGDGRVLENMFCVQEKDATSYGLENLLDFHLLRSKFSLVINEMDTSFLTFTIKNGSSGGQQYHTDHRITSQLTQFDTGHRVSQLTLDSSFDQIEDLVKDGAGRVAKSTSSAAKSTTNAVKSAARCIITPTEEDDQTKSGRYILEPQFDVERPIQVWLDNHENISIEVHGENMVLGIHVLYMQDGKEKLRVPCTDSRYMPQWVDGSNDPQKPTKQTLSNIPLQFSTQGFKNLDFEDPGGEFRVQLAFGHRTVTASQVNIRLFDALENLKVAERFSLEPPAKLLDLLIFWGTATAQAQCTAAYYAIQKYPQDADDIVQKTLTELRDVPPELALLDQLLPLLDTSQISLSNVRSLPPKMQEALQESTRDASSSTLIVPYFSSDNKATAAWTFGGCYTRTIRQMITKEMLSKKQTAEQLASSLDKELADGPKQMILAYLNHQFGYKEYKKEYAIGEMKTWNKEKHVLKDSTLGFGIAGGSLPVVNLPIIAAGMLLDSDFLIGLGVAIGMPTGMLAAGLSGTAWWLCHVASSPFRMSKKRPGLMADWKRSQRSADNYEQKLQAAALLFQCITDPPHVACRLEFALYAKLKDRVPKPGCYNQLSTTSVKNARYEATTVLQLANYGLAGAKMYEIRRYLTERKTALGLIGSTQAGKSTFASQAFKVESHPGAGKNARTRVLRHWTLNLPQSKNRQFTLIDFPGSTDHAAPHWYIRGQLLASVLVVILSLKEINSAQAVALVEKACKVRRKDKEISVLFCFTCADQQYETYEDEAAEEMGGRTTAAQLFTQNFESYKKELLDGAAEAAGDADQLAYIGSNMHACCFKPSLQNSNKELARQLHDLKVKNVKWVKDWCLKELLTINKSNHHSGSF